MPHKLHNKYLKYDDDTGCPKKVTNRKKIITKIECCRAKFYEAHDMEALDLSVTKRPKNISEYLSLWSEVQFLNVQNSKKYPRNPET